MKLGTNSVMSVVVPVYNEEAVLPALKERLLDLRRSLPMRVHFILVNDGSTDRTGALLDSFVGEAEGIQAVHLSRNFWTSTGRFGWIVSGHRRLRCSH